MAALLRDTPGRVNALLALMIATAVALPWFLMMARTHGWAAMAALRIPPERLMVDRGLSLPARLIELAPVTLPLGLFGAVRAIRMALVDESNAREAVGGSFWVIWLAVTALAPSAWPNGPQSAFDLVLLVPLSLLAAQTIADLVNRRIPVRTLTWLAPTTAVSVAWWSSASLRNAVDDVFHGRADSATALGLHLAIDLIVISVWLIYALDRWARRRDDRQRRVLAVFLVVVMTIAAVNGILEVLFRHGIDRDLLALRTMILRRNRENPFQVVAVVSPPSAMAARPESMTTPVTEGSSPGGRLRFILRTALPHLPQLDLADVADLLNLPDGQRLVILAGTDQGLNRTVISKLGLEAIHPGRSGILDAYATAQHRPPRGAASRKTASTTDRTIGLLRTTLFFRIFPTRHLFPIMPFSTLVNVRSQAAPREHGREGFDDGDRSEGVAVSLAARPQGGGEPTDNPRGLPDRDGAPRTRPVLDGGPGGDLARAQIIG